MEGYQAEREKYSFQMETGTHFVSCSIIKWLSNLKCLAIDIRLLAQKNGVGTEVAKCVLGQNSSSVLFQSTQQKKAVLAMGVTLQLNGV